MIRRVEGKCRIEYPIGNVLFETAGWASHLRVSPDGERVAFLHHPDTRRRRWRTDQRGARERPQHHATRRLDHALRAGLAQRERDLVHRHQGRRGSLVRAVPASGGGERLLAREAGELTIQASRATVVR